MTFERVSTIPYGRQDIPEADIQVVVDVLRSDFITQGTTVSKLGYGRMINVIRSGGE